MQGEFPSGIVRQHRAIAQAVDPIEIIVAPSGRVEIRWGSGDTCGLGECGKENWSGGVKRSCEREQPYNCQIDFCS